MRHYLIEMKSETRYLLFHIIGSLAFLSIPIISSPDFNYDLAHQFKIPPFQRSFFSSVFLLLFFYLNYYYLIPKYYLNQKKTLFIVLIAVCLALFLILPNQFFHFEFGAMGKHPEFEGRAPGPPPGHFRFFDFGGIISFAMILSLSFLLKLNNQLSEIKSEKQNAEISYLKAQINPHFLFNTLNSLYALAIIKSDEAPNAILKLSGMMRYVVTESSQDFVPLEKEINYINDYIALQQLRMDDSTDFSFKINGNPLGKAIAPLMLIPFIENAFKYGLNPEEDSEISIVLDIQDDSLLLDVKNKMVVDDLPDDLKTETGIENTTKRLDFIYPNKHQLKITEDQNTYHIHLKLELI